MAAQTYGSNGTEGTGQQQVIVVQQPVVQQTSFGFVSCLAYCPACNKNVQTKITKVHGLATWAVSGGICLTGFICGCCLIPFCIDDLKDVHHTCPSCNNILGYKKIFQ